MPHSAGKNTPEISGKPRISLTGMSLQYDSFMRTNYVLIDFENVGVPSLSLLTAEHFRVRVFLGPNNTRLNTALAVAVQEFGQRAEYIVMEASGKNALDFHIAYYVGKLANADPNGYFHIISRDTGYDPLIRHLRTKDILAARSESIESMPCFVSKDEARDTPSKPGAKDMLNEVIVDLAKRETSKPRTVKTLLSTIHARWGKELAASEIDAIYKTLLKQGRVKVEGTKVSYKLPAIPKRVIPGGPARP